MDPLDIEIFHILATSKLDIKQQLMQRLETIVRDDTIVSTNTSGLPIHKISEGRGESFRKRFLGTHFFNPPRYLKLFEVIPTPDTDAFVLERVSWFARMHLGKGIVVAKDTPNFIGNRIGIYRFLKAFDQHGVKPTFAMNTRLAETNPYLLNRIVERGDEITCHGYHMDAIHWNGLGKDVENELIKTSLESLRKLTGQEIKGWLSPAKNESDHTPDLLAANGIEYFSDWVNDDMPYQFRTSNGELTAMPLTTETEDHFVINGNKHSEDSWVEQVCDAADFLRKEADTQGGRILALNIHPWLMGQPHRIAKLEKALEYITQIDGAWPAYAGEIRNNWISQQ